MLEKRVLVVDSGLPDIERRVLEHKGADFMSVRELFRNGTLELSLKEYAAVMLPIGNPNLDHDKIKTAAELHGLCVRRSNGRSAIEALLDSTPEPRPSPVVIVVGLNSISSGVRSRFEPWAQFYHEGRIRKPTDIADRVRCLAVNARLAQKDLDRLENLAAARQIPMPKILSADLLEDVIGEYNPFAEKAVDHSAGNRNGRGKLDFTLQQARQPEAAPVLEPEPIPSGLSDEDLLLLAEIRTLTAQEGTIRHWLRDNMQSVNELYREAERLLPSGRQQFQNTTKGSLATQMFGLVAKARQNIQDRIISPVAEPVQITQVEASESHEPSVAESVSVDEVTQLRAQLETVRRQLSEATEREGKLTIRVAQLEANRKELESQLQKQTTNTVDALELVRQLDAKLRQ